MPRAINGEEGGGGGGGGITTAPTSLKLSSKHHKHRNNNELLLSTPKQEPNTSNDDLASTDEIKVYKDEGACEDEEQNLDNLNEDKIGLVNETEDEKPSILSHPFSVNNLMLYNGQDQLNSAAAAQFALSRNLYHQSAAAAALYHSSPELAHFASWWPAAAAGLYNPLSSPHLRDTFPFSNAFNAANYAASAQQAAAAAAFSRFNPSLFLPPPPPQTSNLQNKQNGHQSQQSAAASSSASPSSSSSTHHSNSNGRHQFNMNKMPPNGSSHLSSPHRHHNNGMNRKQHNHSMNGSMSESPPNEIDKKPKGPHIKKPLNAFMLFMKEQRAQVVSECTLRESAAINQILGRKWHDLDRADQAKYYEMARQERLKHMQLYPGWSARDNYGIKKKRRRKREKVVGENGELPRKCRARYGLHQINLWCKPCRRKKKCIRFTNQEEIGANGSQMQMQNMNNGMPNGMPGLGYPMNLNGLLPNGMFSSGSVGEGSSAGVGSNGSLNGVNSEEDDYDGLDGEDDDEDDDDDDDLDDDIDDCNNSQDSDTENKNHTLTNQNNMTPNMHLNRAVGQSIGNTNLNGFNPNLNLHPISISNGLPIGMSNPLLDHPRNDIPIKNEGL